MSRSEKQKATVERWLEAHCQRDPEQLRRLAAPSLVVQSSAWQVNGIDNYLQSQAALWQDNTTQEIAVEDIIACGNTVAVRWIDKSCLPAPADPGNPDSPAKGASVYGSGCSFFYFAGHHINNIVVYTDTTELARQLA